MSRLLLTFRGWCDWLIARFPSPQAFYHIVNEWTRLYLEADAIIMVKLIHCWQGLFTTTVVCTIVADDLAPSADPQRPCHRLTTNGRSLYCVRKKFSYLLFVCSCKTSNKKINASTHPWQQSSRGQHGAHLGPRSASGRPQYRPHEPWYLGPLCKYRDVLLFFTSIDNAVKYTYVDHISQADNSSC